jgi:hypothetical protein
VLPNSIPHDTTGKAHGFKQYSSVKFRLEKNRVKTLKMGGGILSVNLSFENADCLLIR